MGDGPNNNLSTTLYEICHPKQNLARLIPSLKMIWMLTNNLYTRSQNTSKPIITTILQLTLATPTRLKLCTLATVNNHTYKEWCQLPPQMTNLQQLIVELRRTWLALPSLKTISILAAKISSILNPYSPSKMVIQTYLLILKKHLLVVNQAW